MSQGIPQENAKSSDLPRTIRRGRWDSLLSIEFSPIERWLDSGSGLQSLNVALEETPDSYVITAPLHRFDAQDVHVDLCRGQVIILLAHDDARDDGRECYAEVPIPANARPNRALVNVVGNSLTVTLYRKHNVIKRAASAIIHLGKKADLRFSKE